MTEPFNHFHEKWVVAAEATTNDQRPGGRAEPQTDTERFSALLKTSGRVPREPCDGLDGPFPCSKAKGHQGPHYFYNP